MSVLTEKITRLTWNDATDNCVDTDGIKYTLHYDGKETLVDEKGNHYDFKTNSSGMTRLTLDPFYNDKEAQEKWADQMAISCFKHEHNLTDHAVESFAKRFIDRPYDDVYNLLVGDAESFPGAIGKFVPMGGIPKKVRGLYFYSDTLEHESGKYSLVFNIGPTDGSIGKHRYEPVITIEYVIHERRKLFRQ